MSLNNRPAAEALIQLFNLDMSWDELNKSEPSQQDLMDIKDIVKGIDARRKGELFDSLPTLALLRKAKEAGICFQLSRQGENHDRLKVTMLKNGKAITESIGGTPPHNPPYIDFWERLHLETLGAKHPSYDLKSLGEYALNFMSMYLAERGDVFAFSVELSLERSLGMTSISKSRLTQLSTILNNIFKQLGHPDVQPKVEIRQRSEPGYSPTTTGMF